MSENTEKTVEEIVTILLCDSQNTSSIVLNNYEEYIKNSQKSLQEILEGSNDSGDLTSTNNDLNTNPLEIHKSLTDEQFVEYFRMKRATFADLQREIERKKELSITDFNTDLLLCLWILGTTKSLPEIAACSKLTEEKLVTTCEKHFKEIYNISSKYISWPSETEMLSIEKCFQTEYGFPGVVGCLGSLHIAVNISRESPEAIEYFNENTVEHTIILQAVCDHNLLFRNIFVGSPGGLTPETVLHISPLFKKLIDSNSFLRQSQKHVLGGTEHPQLPTLLTPYSSSNRQISDRESKFNKAHSKVMFTIEKTFRCLEYRFQRIKALYGVEPKFAALAASVMCTLHNFTRLKNDNSLGWVL